MPSRASQMSRYGRLAASQSLGPPILRQDNFNRANTSSGSGLGTPSDGGAAWSGTQNFHINSNQCVTVTGDGGHWVCIDTSAQITKITIDCALTTANQIFFGWGDKSNGNAYCWLFNGTANYYGILRSGTLTGDGGPGGSGAVVGSSTNSSFNDGTTRSLEVDIVGSTFTVKVGGTTVASGTDSVVTTTFNRFGMYASATTDVVFDNLIIYG